MVLRDKGIYVLPDASEVVVRSDDARGYLVYSMEQWGKDAEPLYEIDSEGRVLRYARTTRLKLDDFGDTGRTAE